MLVRPGSRVPADGEIVSGSVDIDESMVTGEPIPVEKGPGDPVTGGTLNQRGGFVMRAERVGRETLLARIVQMVAEAQRSRAPIQRLADAVAAWFVPAVVLAAVVTFVLWAVFGPPPALAFALINAVAATLHDVNLASRFADRCLLLYGDGRWDIGACSDVLDEERLTELYDTRMEAVDWRATRLFIPSGDVAAQ